jgi:hypothetical protein
MVEWQEREMKPTRSSLLDAPASCRAGSAVGGGDSIPIVRRAATSVANIPGTMPVPAELVRVPGVETSAQEVRPAEQLDDPNDSR